MINSKSNVMADFTLNSGGRKLIRAIIIMSLLLWGIGSMSVPFVAFTLGPTYNLLGTLSSEKLSTVPNMVDNSIVEITPIPQANYFAGKLNMTTVKVIDGLSLANAVKLWAFNDYKLFPRELYYPSSETDIENYRKNIIAFNNSTTAAKIAAFQYLKIPTIVKVVGLVPKTEFNLKNKVQLKLNDVIKTVDGVNISTASDLAKLISTKSSNEVLTLKVERNRKRIYVKQALNTKYNNETNKTMNFLGIYYKTKALFPGKVKINLKNMGGPSAGLMIALTIIDKLTPGYLNYGKFVAGTGMINEQGKVGPIGGVQFKLRAALRAGAQIFLIPKANCSEIKPSDYPNMLIISVNTLAEAVTALKNASIGASIPQCK